MLQPVTCHEISTLLYKQTCTHKFPIFQVSFIYIVFLTMYIVTKHLYRTLDKHLYLGHYQTEQTRGDSGKKETLRGTPSLSFG